MLDCFITRCRTTTRVLPPETVRSAASYTRGGPWTTPPRALAGGGRSVGPSVQLDRVAVELGSGTVPVLEKTRIRETIPRKCV